MKKFIIIWDLLAVSFLLFYSIKYLIYPETITNFDVRLFSVLVILKAIEFLIEAINKIIQLNTK